MSISATQRPSWHGAPQRADATPARAGTPAASRADEAVDPALALLQKHQVGLITPQLVRAAERRLELALDAARAGRSPDPSLLLEQLTTDLGITLSLP